MPRKQAPPLTQISDPRMLRAIAHPVRNRILDELGAGGPMRAADLAERLKIPANQASFHLRQLARYGLVVEAPEAARDKRDRVWKTVHEGGTAINLDKLAEEPGGKAAVAVFRRQWWAEAHDAVDRAGRPERHKDSMVAVSQGGLRLTKAEARKLSEDLSEVYERWRLKGQSSGKTARTYELLWILQPAAEVRDA